MPPWKRRSRRSPQAVPATWVAEILDGALHTRPRPARPHTNTASVLGGELHGPFRRGNGGPGGWVILDEPELLLGPKPDKIVPDLAGFRRARMPDALGPSDAPAYYDVAPDWVCEILSPRTEATHRGTKMRLYRREGATRPGLRATACACDPTRATRPG